MDTNVQDFEVTTRDLEQLSRNYNVILRNEGVKSLQEYVVLKGGTGSDALAITLRNEPDGVFADLVSRISSTSSRNYILQISNLTGPKFNTLASALDLLCAAPTKGDVVQLRSQCNMVIATTAARLASMHQMAETLATATYQLLDAYPSEATRYGYDRSTTAAQKRSSLVAQFSKQASQMVDTYRRVVKPAEGNPGYYNLFAGLSGTLVSNLKAVNCNNNQSGMPLLSGWVKDAANEYLVTNCLSSSSPVLARYWLTKDRAEVSGSDDPANILGVLIPQQSRDPRRSQTRAYFGMIDSIGMKRSRAAVPNSFLTNDGSEKQNGPKVVEGNYQQGPPERLQPDTSVFPWTNSFLKGSNLTLHRLRYTIKPSDFSNFDLGF